MADTTFTADPTRLMVAAAVGIVVLLVLIIKMKLHPVLSMMISAILIGIGAGMPLSMISETVEKGVGETLQGNCLTGRTWFYVWRHSGIQRRCESSCPDVNQQIWTEKGGGSVGYHRTGYWNYSIF